MMINEQTSKDAYIAKFSGLAEYKNEKEMWWDVGCLKFTIEFINDSISHTTVRTYYSDRVKQWTADYKNGLIHGMYTVWAANGRKMFEKEFKNGIWSGKLTVWSNDGHIISETMCTDGDEIP